MSDKRPSAEDKLSQDYVKNLGLWSRFFAKIKFDSNGCWIWTGSTREGYGKISVFGTAQSTHRISFAAFKGPLLKPLVPDHLCRVTRCANPDHLEAVTERVNMLRGVSYVAQCAKKTHCPQGHPLSGTNLYLEPLKSGFRGRSCRTCRVERTKVWRRKMAGPPMTPKQRTERASKAARARWEGRT